MILLTVLLTFAVFAVLVVLQTCRAFGARHGTPVGVMMVLLVGAVGFLLEWTRRHEPPPPEDQTASTPVVAQTCYKCHPSYYQSWRRTFHRTMTREATPEYVKGDFNDAVFVYQGVTARLTRQGKRFYMETPAPEWLNHKAMPKLSSPEVVSPPRRKFSVDLVVGSHWFQQYMHRDDAGRYLRLPLAYHIVEKRWIHLNGAFLGPNKPFFARTVVWNQTCLYCHNTRPVKNPFPVPGQWAGYKTTVGEYGISCEACHGSGQRHVRVHQNPARRLAQYACEEADPSIVNPAKLPVERADQVCGRCHGGTMPRLELWNPYTQADPFLAGRDLTRFWHMPRSEAEQKLLAKGVDPAQARHAHPEATDNRFWPDGTPLSTALEYQGMTMSACYENAQGKMSCLSCHSMHHADPNHQVKAGLRGNDACYSCHDGYRNKLAEHTHHPANSPGSLCYNCHMPYQVYSLLNVHRSHRISVPRIEDSIGVAAKPHACNLCHLDKSLGWTQTQLGKWYGTKPQALSHDEQTVAAGVLYLAKGDARMRGVVAGAFTWPPAMEASGRDWPALVLTRLLENERYEAVRYSGHKALRALYGDGAKDYDYEASAAERAGQIQKMRQTLERGKRFDSRRYPFLFLPDKEARGGPIADLDRVFHRLLRARNDVDVFINE